MNIRQSSIRRYFRACPASWRTGQKGKRWRRTAPCGMAVRSHVWKAVSIPVQLWSKGAWMSDHTVSLQLVLPLFRY